MGSRDFAQVPWLVRVHAARYGQSGGHDVETLDRQNRVQGRVFGAGQGQVAFSNVVGRRQQHPSAALTHVGGQASRPACAAPRGANTSSG